MRACVPVAPPARRRRGARGLSFRPWGLRRTARVDATQLISKRHKEKERLRVEAEQRLQQRKPPPASTTSTSAPSWPGPQPHSRFQRTSFAAQKERASQSTRGYERRRTNGHAAVSRQGWLGLAAPVFRAQQRSSSAGISRHARGSHGSRGASHRRYYHRVARKLPRPTVRCRIDRAVARVGTIYLHACQYN